MATSDKNIPLLRVQEPVELQGTLERVLFHNEGNGYTVLRVKPAKGDAISAVGHMASPQPGVSLRLSGEWMEHSRYGRQLQFSCYETLMPATAEGIRDYLASGLIKGVREATAKKIVDAFGAKTIEILDESPDRLGEIKGISARTIGNIIEGWRQHQSIRDLIMFLQPHGVSTSYAVRIFKHYGSQALNVIQDNPYRMAMDIHGIGFITADNVALKLGVESCSPLRAEAGVLYILRRLSDDGHIYYPLEELAELTASELEIDEKLAEEAILSLHRDERVVVEDLVSGSSVTRGVFLGRYHHCESGIAHYLQRIVRSPKSVFFSNPEEALAAGIAKSSLELAEGQIEAVRVAIRSKAMVITGGPGTGKTTIINTIIKVFQGVNARILLAAPTGRAAKRMSETSGLESKTIHRLLEYSPNEDGFARSEDNPLACGLIVIDEASMLDTTLMYHLLKAIPLGATVIFVGDVHQLPSVGPGNVLRDIMTSGVLPVVELTEIFRQAAESAIIMNAHSINRGDMPQLRPLDGGMSDFYFIRQDDPEKAADMIVDLVANHIPRRFRFHPLDEIQVLTPMHKGAAGATALNAKLQNALNRQTQKIVRGEKQFRLDDKVMQIRNNYEKDVFNGDIGRICYVDMEDREITVRYEDKNVIYTQEELDEIVPAYAISIHKSQGSEYPAVVVPILTQHYILLQRNLLYTGVTRGKKLVVIVGSLKALHIAIANNSTNKRYTWLSARLKEAIV